MTFQQHFVEMWWAYVVIVVMIALSAYFSATEIAFNSSNKMRLRRAAENGSKTAEMAYKVGENFTTTLSAILVGNNLANIAVSTCTTLIIMSLFPGKLIKEIANIAGAEISVIDPESYIPQLAYLGVKKLGDIERMITENYDLAIKLANKALSVANLDIVSSSVALRFLCRAELLNKNYDFDKIVEFLKISLREQTKAERQAKLLLKQKGEL